MTSQSQPNIYEKIGGALKSIRLERELTLKEVKEMTDINIATISQIERGVKNYSLGWIIHYANTLGFNPEEVFIRAFQKDFQNKQLDRLFERFEEYLPEIKKNNDNT